MLGEFNYKTHRILAESPTVIWVYPAVYEELFLISYLSKKIFTEVGGKQSPFPCVDKHSALSLARLTGSEKLIEVFEELTNKDYKKLEQLEKDIERKNLQAKHRGENLKKFDFSTLKSRIMSRCVKTAESYLPKESSRTSTFETEKDLAVIEWISSQNKKKRARFYQKRRLIGSIGFGVLTSIGTFIALDKVLFNYTFKKINQAAPISAGGNESGVNSNISLPNPSSSNSNTSDRERSSSPSTYIYDDVVEVKKLISVSYSNEQLPGYNPNEGFKSIPPDLSKYKTAGILNKDWIRLGNEYLSFTPKKIIVSSKQYDSLFSVQGHNEKRRVEFKLPGNQKALFLQFSLADLNLENKNNIYNINVYSEDELLWSGKCYGQQIVSLPLSIPDTNRLVIEYSVFGQGNSVSSGIPELHFTRAELLFEL